MKQDFKILGTRPIRPDGLDKVTGKAMFGSDKSVTGMLHARILRSPHAHAEIVSIDTSKAEALAGVKAVITGDDFADVENRWARYTMQNCMAQGRALYDGHAVAAVAAISKTVAAEALKLIEVEYKILPHVTDVDEAMAPGAPVLHEGVKARKLGDDVSGNTVGYYSFGHGDIEAGFANAELVIDRTFKTAAVHQGYIEPHGCLADLGGDGRGELWCSTQGHYMVREVCSEILGIDSSQLRVTASEIGGGFGGKTTVFIEPVALKLSQKAGKPVKLVMSREEVFRASGPTMSASMDIKIGMTKAGKITGAHAKLRYQGGAFPYQMVMMGAMSAFAAYDLEHVQAEGWDVMTNRPKMISYRAPGAPMAVYAVESVMDELCQKLELDPIDTRLMNAAREGTKSSYGPTFKAIGLVEALEAAKAHPHYSAPLAPNTGRGVSCGFWFNFGGQVSVSMAINADGTVNLIEGNPDIGGSRASISMMAAEALGIEYDRIRTIVGDTASVGFSDVTDGSRVTFAVGIATINAANAAIKEMCKRAAKIWEIDAEAVEWVDGAAQPSGHNAGNFPPMSLAEIAATSGKTGGPIAGHHEGAPDKAGVSFGVHMVDVEVDPETGFTSIKRYTAFQDVGKAIHPAYVEGQIQGGAVQGIGWALNEEYIYGEDGLLQNPGFLDYRIPVASDLPMIDAVIIEVPNPGHPYGVRGCGETAIVPPLAAVSNGVAQAIGVRMFELPMSPPKILKAL
ncbi:MAG: molybdopterin-dependent oxidoreductase [Rhodobacteraceae bacterium]|nr:molybdopterin-dependent oxidoreductase [Paracoccaceae bacterium]